MDTYADTGRSRNACPARSDDRQVMSTEFFTRDVQVIMHHTIFV